MERINIVELLKDCPKGMELNCLLFKNPVKYDGYVDDDNYPIKILTEEGAPFYLTNEGYMFDILNSECVIFPKGKTTWDGFVPPCKFKDGDIITDSFGTCIFKGEGEIEGTVDYYCGISSVCNRFSVKDNKCRTDGHYGFIVNYRLATEEEKQKLFQTIKDNGYKWKPETKTLEKLPKFKVGDRIQEYGTHINHPILVVTSLEWDRYRLNNGRYIKFGDEHAYKLLKFDINTLVPFESRVLVRGNEEADWIPTFWGYKSMTGYVTTFGEWSYCIPYEGNKHLLGTTDDCNDFYKTWEL